MTLCAVKIFCNNSVHNIYYVPQTIQVFNARTNKVETISVASETTAHSFQEHLKKRFEIPLDKQLLLFKDGEKINPMGRILDQIYNSKVGGI